MGTIRKRTSKLGEITYCVEIRIKGHEVYKTFSDEEDAKMYLWYKEKLIYNIINYEIPIKERVTLTDIYELKIREIDPNNKRSIDDFKYSLQRTLPFLPEKKLFSEYTYEDWLNCCKELFNTKVNRGSKEKNRDMSLSTLRKIFAHHSSCISCAQRKGIDIENFPLKVLNSHITPLLNKEKYGEVDEENIKKALNDLSESFFPKPQPILVKG